MTGSRSSKLLELLRQSPAQQVARVGYVDSGVAHPEPFPFLGIVNQQEMKLALLLAVINPAVGGVLLYGPRGTAKTTAVRSLIDLLPEQEQSLCPEGCTEQMLEEGGMDVICKECLQKVGYGEPLTGVRRTRIVNLPLNARLEDVVGGIDERLALEHQRMRLERGLLSQADGHILYIDEINMLDDAIADAILDAAAQGYYSVRRGPQKLTYRSQFLLIGSMNPEEGNLRPQLMDRFGLRAVARGLTDQTQRYLAYQHAMWYRRDPVGMAAAYAEHTLALAEEIGQAQNRLRDVTISKEAQRVGLRLIQSLAIHSNRAEITLFEAGRAHAAADERDQMTPADVRAVAPFSLRFRNTAGMEAFLKAQEEEDARLRALLHQEEE